MSQFSDDVGQSFRTNTLVERLLSESNGVKYLSSEGLLITVIALNGSMSIKNAISISNLSYRSFYNILNSLKSKGIVTLENCNIDKRVKNIRLSDYSYSLLAGATAKPVADNTTVVSRYQSEKASAPMNRALSAAQ